MEKQILKVINHIKYISKKVLTISGMQRFLGKKKNLPPPLAKPLSEKLYVKCNKIAKLVASSKSLILVIKIENAKQGLTNYFWS